VSRAVFVFWAQVAWTYYARPPEFCDGCFGRYRYRCRCPISRCTSVSISDWSTSTTSKTCEYHRQPYPPHSPICRPSRIEPPAVFVFCSFFVFWSISLVPRVLDHCCCCLLLLASAELETGVPETGKGDRGAQERGGRHRAC
ncbi:unnamed protein product, partial [Ectocarpus sp. 13 AM-2016]